MTETEWLAYAETHKEKLESLIRAYHPASRGEKRELPITASNAEFALSHIRKRVKAEWDSNLEPVEHYRRAVELKRWSTMYVILNNTWFGVPESTDCWNVPGFKEAVHLLEDVPDG